MRVGEICNRHTTIIGKQDTVYTAALLMRDKNTNYVVVVESVGGHNIPIGSFTDRDIVTKMVASNLDVRMVTVGAIMNFPPLLANEQDSVTLTLRRMRDMHLGYITVVNAQNTLVGVLSIDDVLEMLVEQLSDIGYILNQSRLQPRHRNFA